MKIQNIMIYKSFLTISLFCRRICRAPTKARLAPRRTISSRNRFCAWELYPPASSVSSCILLCDRWFPLISFVIAFSYRQPSPPVCRICICVCAAISTFCLAAGITPRRPAPREETLFRSKFHQKLTNSFKKRQKPLFFRRMKKKTKSSWAPRSSWNSWTRRTSTKMLQEFSIPW